MIRLPPRSTRTDTLFPSPTLFRSDDSLALGIDQPFAIPGARAGRGVAGKCDASGRSVAHIAEHHRLDIDSGAPFAGDGIQAAIDFRAVAFPTREDSTDRAPELILRLLRERRAGLDRKSTRLNSSH